ncbi:hypothetical protein ACFLYD_01830 [Chloroflexota bacterium]
MVDHERLIAAYGVDVRFPDVSGMEHLEMLTRRSEIAQVEHSLTEEQRIRLSEADKALVQQARRFHQAIQRIANLDTWRCEENVPPSHWWWYLDVLVELSRDTAKELLSEAVPA